MKYSKNPSFEDGRNVKDEPEGRSATFKIIAGFMGVLGLSLAWMATSFAAGAEDKLERQPAANIHRDNSVVCTTEDEEHVAILGAGVFDDVGCDHFFYMEDGQAPEVFEKEAGSCGDFVCNYEILPLYWNYDQFPWCAAEAKNGQFRLKNSCVGTSATPPDGELVLPDGPEG